MSEELKRGIPKAVQTGKVVQFTEKEKEKHDNDFEKILKSVGALDKDQSIKDLKRPE